METTDNTTSNVIDIRTKQAILPKKVRGALLGQYTESKHNEDSAEQFLAKFEQRLVSDIAMAGARMVKGFAQELMEGKNGK